MPEDKPYKTPISKPDDLVRPKDEAAKVELSEEELASVSGGFGSIKGESTEKDHKDWIG